MMCFSTLLFITIEIISHKYECIINNDTVLNLITVLCMDIYDMIVRF